MSKNIYTKKVNNIQKLTLNLKNLGRKVPIIDAINTTLKFFLKNVENFAKTSCKNF